MMKWILAILLLVAPLAQAQLTFQKFTIRADRLVDGGMMNFSTQTGTCQIDLSSGKVTLINTTNELAAKAFWNILQGYFPEVDGAIKPTHIGLFLDTAGRFEINVKDGSVRWPGTKSVDAASRLFWDAVVLEFKERRK